MTMYSLGRIVTTLMDEALRRGGGLDPERSDCFLLLAHR